MEAGAFWLSANPEMLRRLSWKSRESAYETLGASMPPARSDSRTASCPSSAAPRNAKPNLVATLVATPFAPRVLWRDLASVRFHKRMKTEASENHRQP